MSERMRMPRQPPTPGPSPTGGEEWGRGAKNVKHQPRDPSWDHLEVGPFQKKRMKQAARDLRKNPTESESVLWNALRANRLDGRKFRREQTIGRFVVDFYCASERLVVEVDGGVHAEQEREDRMRQEALETLGLRFVRVTDKQVMDDLPAVLSTIRNAFAAGSSSPLPHSSPPVGEGPGVGAAGARAEAWPDDPQTQQTQPMEVAR